MAISQEALITDRKTLARWLRKARRTFTGKSTDGADQWDRAVDLARDVWKTLDPLGFKESK
jgi:hypothetical protein